MLSFIFIYFYFGFKILGPNLSLTPNTIRPNTHLSQNQIVKPKLLITFSPTCLTRMAYKAQPLSTQSSALLAHASAHHTSMVVPYKAPRPLPASSLTPLPSPPINHPTNSKDLCHTPSSHPPSFSQNHPTYSIQTFT